MKRQAGFAALLLTLWAARPALADEIAPAAPTAVRPILPPALSSGSDGGSRVAGGILMGAGALAIGVGSYLALSKDRRVGGPGTDESSLVPVGIGIGMAGAAMAMFGSFLWLSAPNSSTRVAVVPSGIVMCGSF
jgi:hypothetical protein